MNTERGENGDALEFPYAMHVVHYYNVYTNKTNGGTKVYFRLVDLLLR